MAQPIILDKKKFMILQPNPPYNFNANFHKPSHFPSSDNFWEKDKYWITMVWDREKIGLKFGNVGSINKPEIKLGIYSTKTLSQDFINNLISEIRWRFNFNQDLYKFYKKFAKDKYLKNAIKKWRGTKPIAANSLYETVVIYFVLQNATVKRSTQMLENLFNKFGEKVKFNGKILSTFWEPSEMITSTEQELRDLKLGYRTKFLMKLTEKFTNKQVNEFKLRKMPKQEVKEKVLQLYGVGPASVEYLLFEDFYFLDALETIPPWEQKIMSKLLFNKNLVPTQKILNFFKKRYKGYEKLAFHYLWEDLFWRRKHQHIDWLEKEIRL